MCSGTFLGGWSPINLSTKDARLKLNIYIFVYSFLVCDSLSLSYFYVKILVTWYTHSHTHVHILIQGCGQYVTAPSITLYYQLAECGDGQT